MTVQGEVLYDDFLEDALAMTTEDIVLNFISNGEPLMVQVDYQGVNTQPTGSIETQVALSEIDQVFFNFQCLDACPVRDGFDLGIVQQTDTFSCVYCDSSLNQAFDASTGTCVCADFFT